MGRTLAQKIWDSHVVRHVRGRDLLYMDLQLVHDVSSQAFGGLELRDMRVRRPRQTVATMDHTVSTDNRRALMMDPAAVATLRRLRENCEQHEITLFGLGAPEQGIVHVVAPEQGLTRPGITIACGDSHTSTHGALGALAFGIGATQVEQVLATQCLLLAPLKHMAVEINGDLRPGVTAKDVALAAVRAIGPGGGVGHLVEYRGTTVSRLTMEGRLTLCNMSVEAGARAGLIAPDETTLAYVNGRRFAPSGEFWDAAEKDWLALRSDPDAVFDRTVTIDGSALEPTVTWGTTPQMSVGVSERVPLPSATDNPEQAERALRYMGLQGGEQITDLRLDKVFIGSCTNARIEDLRAAADVVAGRSVAPHVNALVVPGSTAVKLQAEREGLDTVFKDAGFEWRQAGCSMCLGMNDDNANSGERVASTSNRNFEGRQGPGARTHLVSPVMAAAAAIAGHFVDVTEVM